MSLIAKVNDVSEALAVIQARIAARPEMQAEMQKLVTFFAEWYGENTKLYAKLFDEELTKFLNESR